MWFWPVKGSTGFGTTVVRALTESGKRKFHGKERAWKAFGNFPGHSVQGHGGTMSHVCSALPGHPTLGRASLRAALKKQPLPWLDQLLVRK